MATHFHCMMATRREGWPSQAGSAPGIRVQIHQELPTKNMGGAGTKSIQGRERKLDEVAASPPTPSIPGDDSEAPGPSTTVGRLSSPGRRVRPHHASTRSLVLARRHKPDSLSPGEAWC